MNTLARAEMSVGADLGFDIGILEIVFEKYPIFPEPPHVSGGLAIDRPSKISVPLKNGFMMAVPTFHGDEVKISSHLGIKKRVVRRTVISEHPFP